MAKERRTLTPEELAALTAPRKGHSAKDIGIYAMLILLVIGELNMLHRIDDMGAYVDQRDRQVQASLQTAFEKKLAAANAAQNAALENATRGIESRIERRFGQMQSRARQAEVEADQAAQRLEQMQASEDSALVSIQQMLAQKASASDVRSLSREVALTRNDVDLASARIARLHAQFSQTASATEDQIVDLNEQVAAIRRQAPRFLPFTLVRNRPQSIGGISLVLTKTQQDGHFDLALRAGGVHLETKNATPSEPIFFVPTDPQRAYEVIINHVERGEVRGFLGASGDTLALDSSR